VCWFSLQSARNPARNATMLTALTLQEERLDAKDPVCRR
jgi:hypothetical protein